MITEAISILAIPKVPRVSLRVLVISGFVLVVFLLIFYVFQVTEITKANFFLSDHGKKIAALTQENKDLEFNLSQKNSLTNLEIVLKNLNYEETNKIYYIQLLGSTVAARPK